MKFEKVRYKNDIQKGDLLLVESTMVASYTVKQVKEVGTDIEIILDKRKNLWFSMHKYLLGKSWIKEAYIVRPNCED